jgi:membrane associated rhomboid family serine protease
MYFFYYLPVRINAGIRKFPFMTLYFSLICLGVFVAHRFFSYHLPLSFYNLIYIPGSTSLLSAITAAFLHFGYMHLIGNLLYLLLLGRYAEDRLGGVLFTVVFISSAWIGNVLQGIYNTHILHYDAMGIIGASGAVSGILGVYAVRFFTSKLQIAYWAFFPLQAINRAGKVEIPALLALAFWFLLQSVRGLAQMGGANENVAFVTHISGFLWGAVIALMCGHFEKGRIEALWQRVKSHMEKGRYFEAQEALFEYLEKCPEDPEAYLALARSYLVTKNRSKATENYQKACDLFLSQFERWRAEDTFREALRGCENLSLPPEIHLNIALGLERNLKPELAVKAYENFQRRYPHHPDASFTILRAANIYRSTFSNIKAAWDCYTQLIRRYPDDDWADFAREQIRQITLRETAPV